MPLLSNLPIKIQLLSICFSHTCNIISWKKQQHCLAVFLIQTFSFFIPVTIKHLDFVQNRVKLISYSLLLFLSYANIKSMRGKVEKIWLNKEVLMFTFHLNVFYFVLGLFVVSKRDSRNQQRAHNFLVD